MILASLAAFPLLLLVGCAATSATLDNTAAAPSLFANDADTSAPGSIGKTADSLFKSDQAVMSNEDIEKILSSKVSLPPKARIAVVRIGGRYPMGRTWWSQSVAQIEQQGNDHMLAAFRASPRVGKVMILPTMLTPAQVTIPYLREAAARVQADMLLVYRTYTQSYQEQRFFGGGDVHAYCTVESVLLDTRSGIVVDTTVKTQPFSAQKTSKDLEFDETVARAEQEATAKALGDAAEELAKNLTATDPVAAAAK
jgi:hypothetical protein